MNPRRIVRTLIVVLVTIVGRWLIRAPLTPMPDVEPTPPLSGAEPLPPSPSSSPIFESERSEGVEPTASRPSLSPPDTTFASAANGTELETPVAALQTLDDTPPGEGPDPSPESVEATPAGRPSLAPSLDTASASGTIVAMPVTSIAVRETPVAVLERPVAVLERPAAVLERPVAAPERPVAVPVTLDAVYETPLAASDAFIAALGTSVAGPDTPVAAPPTLVSRAEVVEASESSETFVAGPRTSDSQAPERERDDVGDAPVGSPAFAPAVDAPEPSDATPPRSHANVDTPLVRESRRSRRRSESIERPGRLLGGAGFLLAAIACFIASFVLFVRLTTPDRSAPVVYAVVPYVAASERNVPPALASFMGEVGSGDMWLVVRLPVAARYVALTGLRTVDRWTTNRFALSGTKPTLASNAASCYSGVGVADGPPQLTPLPEGLVVRDAASASLAPERLVRVDVGALLADATSTKTLVCAIAPPARTGFASYAATIGVPNVPASDATGSRVKLAALPLGVDYSTFGDASSMRFTQTSLAVATDPLHATLDVAGFETFAYDDPEGDARRDVLLFIAGALATIGAVAVTDALRPWLGIERR